MTLDLALIELLDRQCFPREKRYNYPETQWWIISDQRGRPAAYGGLLHYEAATIYLCRSGVLPKYRGMGLQTRLIQIRLRWARRHGVRVAISYTSTRNVASANNLIECGFSLYNPAYAWVGHEGVVYWRRDLKEPRF